MKTKTLSLLCIFALLSVNLVSSSVIKRGLDDNKAANKKNLIEVESDCSQGIVASAVGYISEDCIPTDPPTG
jgi:hypothetical protein